MHVSVDRLEFAPPPAPGMLRAFVFAIIAHLLLMLALTSGIRWNREPVTVSAEAELWSRLPQEAAPKLVEAPPPPPPPPAPAPVPAPPPVVAKPQPAPEPAPRQADIALEREKEKEKKEAARRKQLALEREKKLEAERELEAQRKLEARQKQELAKAKAAQDRQKQEAAKRQREAEESKRMEAQREDNLKRIQGLAGATGSQEARGTAVRASNPSDSYAGRIRARVKPNIVFTDDISGNPRAEVEVRTSPDGTIVGQRIVKSSGVRSWDDAVLKAVIKTEVLPRDVDGRVHSPLILEFRPKD